HLHALRDGMIALQLFMMSLPVESSSVLRTIRRPQPALLAVAINFLLFPLIAWGISFGFEPNLGAGLLVVAATPCTLTSATVWTRRAGGNDTAATLVTIFTNLICFIVTPSWLWLQLGPGKGGQSDLTFGAMVLKLSVLVVLPLVVAQLLRLNAPIARWATR